MSPTVLLLFNFCCVALLYLLFFCRLSFRTYKSATQQCLMLIQKPGSKNIYCFILSNWIFNCKIFTCAVPNNPSKGCWIFFVTKSFNCCSEIFLVCAILFTCIYAAAGEKSGSSPLPLAVTSSEEYLLSLCRDCAQGMYQCDQQRSLNNQDSLVLCLNPQNQQRCS